ncbi:transglutaminase TgpA family protein [Gracilibacillus kekensis]|uniref:Transglutaminase-like enzyme, putative cysteine protease n=1 Tax=Gracilibacillus kekensis TaxID=1027249 RepID=A0A1M7Q839_9BACI|nr:transglutaminase domain-containing protein [Gracilibacillus kekensis]SHN26694.1 Transglutaminase-like enzyme, putative cysteine protease [Gracilibacillus kekensis]
MTSKISLSSISSFILLLAGFLLFWEWLRPLEEVTDTGNSHLFVIYTAICFLVSFFLRNGWVKFALKFIALLLILDYLFLAETLLSREWLQLIKTEVSYNLEIAWNNDWYLMTAFFRSLLFLLLLWLMSYLLHYWFTVANKFFIFVVLTIVYLAVLDTFTVYDAPLAMVRTFVISFVVLGLSRYVKLMDNNETNDKQSNLVTWMLPIVAIVLFAALLGIYSPKPTPQWPDPVPFIKSTAGHVGFGDGPVQKVGYGEDDSRLGGSFVQDDTTVFEAIVHDNVYWRIESKDVYTGKGWERSSELDYAPLENGEVQWRTFPLENTETTPYEAMVRPESTNELPKVVYPYGINRIESMQRETFYMDMASGMIEAESSEQSPNRSYSVQYDAPSFSLDELRNNSNNDPEDIKQRYLQLPEDLPERVSNLAAEVVEDEESRYDKAKAIESYFAQNGYTYQIEDVSVPDEGEDYVDQFLFETHVGYCDNFSTSMVVMLRSLDIPARWVKGFTGGAEVADQPPLPDGYSLYEVTNNNAHSWVEVFFPDTGWVPFEPTSGFTNPTDFYQDVTSDIDTGDSSEEENATEEETSEEEPELEDAEAEEEQEDNLIGDLENNDNWNGWLYFWISIIVVILILATVAFLKRNQIRDWYTLRKWHKLTQKLEIEPAYIYLLTLLEKRGYKRRKGQTLRQYAVEIDQQLRTTEMYDLTLAYEQYIYRNQEISEDKSKLRNLFQRVIDQILA